MSSSLSSKRLSGRSDLYLRVHLGLLRAHFSPAELLAWKSPGDHNAVAGALGRCLQRLPESLVAAAGPGGAKGKRKRENYEAVVSELERALYRVGDSVELRRGGSGGGAGYVFMKGCNLATLAERYKPILHECGLWCRFHRMTKEHDPKPVEEEEVDEGEEQDEDEEEGSRTSSSSSGSGRGISWQLREAQSDLDSATRRLRHVRRVFKRRSSSLGAQRARWVAWHEAAVRYYEKVESFRNAFKMVGINMEKDGQLDPPPELPPAEDEQQDDDEENLGNTEEYSAAEGRRAEGLQELAAAAEKPPSAPAKSQNN